MSKEADLELAQRYVRWLNEAPTEHVHQADALLADDFRWQEMPTRFGRRGRSGDRDVLLDALRGTIALIRDESIEIERAFADGAGQVAVAVTWRGILRDGDTPLRADGVMLLQCRDGRLVSAQDYLCFDG